MVEIYPREGTETIPARRLRWRTCTVEIYPREGTETRKSLTSILVSLR